MSDRLNRIIRNTELAIDFFDSLNCETISADLMVCYFNPTTQKFDQAGFGLKYLSNLLSSMKSLSLKRHLDLFWSYFECKIVQNPPKVIKFDIVPKRLSLYSTFADLFNDFQRITSTSIQLEEIFDFTFDPSEDTLKNAEELLKYFVKANIYALFYLLFFDLITFLHKLNPVTYFTQPTLNCHEYNNQPKQFIKPCLYKNLSQLRQLASLNRGFLRSETFRVNVQKNFKCFFPFVEIFSKTDELIAYLERIFQYNIFCLDGLLSNFLLT